MSFLFNLSSRFDPWRQIIEKVKVDQVSIKFKFTICFFNFDVRKIKSVNFEGERYYTICIRSGENILAASAYSPSAIKRWRGRQRLKESRRSSSSLSHRNEGTSRFSSLRVSWNFHNTPLLCIRYTLRSWIEFLGIQREKLTFSDTPTVSRYGKRASSQRKSPIAGRGRKEIHSPWSVQPVSRTSFINFLV